MENIILLGLIVFFAIAVVKGLNPIIALIILAVCTRLTFAEQINFDVYMKMLNDFTYVLTNRIQNGGINILLIGAYMSYLKQLGATELFVKKMSKIVKAIKWPYVVLAMTWLLGACLGLFINSATSLSVLLMGTMAPILLKYAVSRTSICSVISTTLCLDWSPADTACIMAANTAKVEHLHYWTRCQLPIALVLIVILFFVNFIYHRFIDNKKGCSEKYQTEDTTLVSKSAELSFFYVFMPTMPILCLCILTFIFNIKATIGIATALSMLIVTVAEMFRRKKVKDTLQSLVVVIESFGRDFSSVILLIVAGEFMVQGINCKDVLNKVFHCFQGTELSSAVVLIIIAIIILLSSFAMGTSAAPFYSLLPFVPVLCQQYNLEATSVLVVMQYSAGIGRSMSPISAVLLTTSASGCVSPIDVAKRNFIPMLIAFITMLITVMLFWKAN